MNILTPNRILEAGDEYRDNGTWKPITPEDIGTQVMFSSYKEVRRPKEQGSQVERHQSAKLEIEGSIPSPALQSPDETLARIEAELIRERDLTISPNGERSLQTASERPSSDGAKAKTDALPAASTVTEKAEKVNVPTPTPSGVGTTPSGAISIGFDKKHGCRWIGRNGTFYQQGIGFYASPDCIRIVPYGRRGEAKNAMIEFPVEIIPQLIDWLKEHQP